MSNLIIKEKNYGMKCYSMHFSTDTGDYVRTSKKFYSAYKKYIPQNRNIAILDVGCGYGNLLHGLLMKGYTNLYGLDLSQDQIDVTKRKVGCECLHGGPLDAPPEWEERFDFIFCNHVLEHVREDKIEIFLNSICLLLKTGGQFIITVPNATSPWAGYSMWHDPTHLRLYSTETLKLTLCQNGFSDIRLESDAPIPYDFITSIRFLLWKIREKYLQMMFIIDIGPGRSIRKKIIVSQGLIGIAVKQKSRSRV